MIGALAIESRGGPLLSQPVKHKLPKYARQAGSARMVRASF